MDSKHQEQSKPFRPIGQLRKWSRKFAPLAEKFSYSTESLMGLGKNNYKMGLELKAKGRGKEALSFFREAARRFGQAEKRGDARRDYALSMKIMAEIEAPSHYAYSEGDYDFAKGLVLKIVAGAGEGCATQSREAVAFAYMLLADIAICQGNPAEAIEANNVGRALAEKHRLRSTDIDTGLVQIYFAIVCMENADFLMTKTAAIFGLEIYARIGKEERAAWMLDEIHAQVCMSLGACFLHDNPQEALVQLDRAVEELRARLDDRGGSAQLMLIDALNMRSLAKNRCYDETGANADELEAAAIAIKYGRVLELAHAFSQN